MISTRNLVFSFLPMENFFQIFCYNCSALSHLILLRYVNLAIGPMSDPFGPLFLAIFDPFWPLSLAISVSLSTFLRNRMQLMTRLYVEMLKTILRSMLLGSRSFKDPT